ncbi:hypothetical protein [Clostridium pasteurianum]|uniref:Uncharacterized protein n=1 Tax=Clostridium pasteurianum BC1 TaxID=86416 RepID=R4K8T9_CLOPA|nr:hypothetical protein [Clostridium pasteurianum]AGK98116.1 hypothetical protein Clopa_3319 [Clostridium pasteurianum BC1]
MINAIVNMLMGVNTLYLLVGVVAIVIILKVVGKILRIALVVGVIALVLYKIGAFPFIQDLLKTINI